MVMAASARGPRCHRWFLGWAAWIAVVAAAGTSRADERSLAVALGLTRGSGADGCLTARELAQRVEARLGRAAFVSAAKADLFVDVRVARAGRSWRATVAASRASGERVGVRELASAGGDCHGLDEDLVLVVALVIDPMATGAPRAQPAAPAPREVVYVPVPVSVPVAGPAPAWAFGARVATAVLGGVLPSAAPAVDAAIATTPPGAWPIELGVIATASASADDGAHGAEVRIALGTVAVCPELVAGARARLQLCGGGAAGALRVRSHGLDPASTGDHAAGLVFGRGRGSLRVAGGLEVVLDAGVTVPLARRSLYYTALDPMTLQVTRHDLTETAAVGWIAALGLALQIR
jgi:hypothetical protein